MPFKAEVNLLTSSAMSAYNHYCEINRERWYRRVMQKKQSRTPVPGFFDAYPQFMETSEIEGLSHINYRHRYLIERNVSLIKGQRILDLASHDGRFSFAAAQAGASYVLGIEARPRLVEAARENVRAYGARNVEFICGDIFQELDRGKGNFDTVFCFGILYHTLDHMSLLRKIVRLQPKSTIVDTYISLNPDSVIEVHDEGVALDTQGAVAESGTPDRILVGWPSRTALETMLKAVGFRRLEYFDWQALKLDSWHGMKNYYLGRRITVTAYT